MRNVPIFLLALIANAAPAAELLIEHVTVVSPEQTQPLADRSVLIRDGRIVSVGEKGVPAKTDARRIDGRGKFLTPGLMDSHVHVSDSAGIPPQVLVEAIRAFSFDVDFQREIQPQDSFEIAFERFATELRTFFR